MTDIIMNALDRDYSLDRAATDLGELMMELELISRIDGPDSPRAMELRKIIPIQEKLALGKLRGDRVFEQLDRLGIRLEKYD